MCYKNCVIIHFLYIYKQMKFIHMHDLMLHLHFWWWWWCLFSLKNLKFIYNVICVLIFYVVVDHILLVFKISETGKKQRVQTQSLTKIFVANQRIYFPKKYQIEGAHTHLFHVSDNNKKGKCISRPTKHLLFRGKFDRSVFYENRSVLIFLRLESSSIFFK